MSDQRPSSGPLSADAVGDAASGAGLPGSVVTSLTELVRLRETRGFSASLVSARLRLAPRQIAALESGDWAALPGRTFIRSSLRSYGRLLEVDVSQLLNAIESQLPGTDVLKPDSDLKRPMPRQGALGFGGSGTGNRWVWLLLLVLGIVALAFFYGGGATLVNRDRQPAARPTSGLVGGPEAGQSGGGAAAEAPATSAGASSTVLQQAGAAGGSGSVANLPTSAAPKPATAVIPPVNLPAAPASVPAAAAQPAPLPADAASTPSAAPQPAPPRDSPPSVARPASAASGATDSRLNPLVMRFPVESWIEVRDAAGTILITGTQAPGTVRELSGDLPLSLVIGNAAGVSIAWRGTPIDLAPHMRLGVARFRIEQ